MATNREKAIIGTFFTNDSNSAMIGRRRSGKTQLILGKILPTVCGTKDSFLITFVPTLKLDPTWVSYVKNANHNIYGATSLHPLFDDLTKLFMKNPGNFTNDNITVLFDDMSLELKDKFLIAFEKWQRHICRSIVSTQYLYDMNKSHRKQIDNWVLFPRIQKQQLITLYDEFVGDEEELPLALFIQWYDIATAKKHNFLFANFIEGVYMHNFDRVFNVPSKQEIERMNLRELSKKIRSSYR